MADPSLCAMRFYLFRDRIPLDRIGGAKRYGLASHEEREPELRV